MLSHTAGTGELFELFGVGGIDEPLLEFDLVRNSAPVEFSREVVVLLILTGAMVWRFPNTSPPELDDNVIGVDRVASLVEDIGIRPKIRLITSIEVIVSVWDGKGYSIRRFPPGIEAGCVLRAQRVNLNLRESWSRNQEPLRERWSQQLISEEYSNIS